MSVSFCLVMVVVIFNFFRGMSEVTCNMLHPVPCCHPNWEPKLWACLFRLCLLLGLLAPLDSLLLGEGSWVFLLLSRAVSSCFLYEEMSLSLWNSRQETLPRVSWEAGYGKDMPCLWINQYWPDGVNRGKRRILSTDLSVIELNLY